MIGLWLAKAQGQLLVVQVHHTAIRSRLCTLQYYLQPELIPDPFLNCTCLTRAKWIWDQWWENSTPLDL